MFVTVIIFLLILGLLIFVHELGHFLTARRNGITAHEFGFGFPPRLVGMVKNPETGKWRIVWGNKDYSGNKTLYSFNWIPLGGFVRIKGEDGRAKDPDSFATKSIWVRFKVLIAGVTMNVVFAWVLISINFMIGVPQIEETLLSDNANASEPQVQVTYVEPETPAEEMGIVAGDVITEVCASDDCTAINTTEDLQGAMSDYKGETVAISVMRGDEAMTVTGEPREEVTEEQGPLGVQIAEVSIVSYPWYESMWWAIGATATMLWTILAAFGSIIWGLLSGSGMQADLAGPVGIAFMTKQMTDLGLSYLLQFAAMLSINLAIINALPFPALDGGRILFLAIEKIQGKPVSRKTEGIAHTVGFVLLISLMIYVTFRDFIRFDIIGSIMGLFG